MEVTGKAGRIPWFLIIFISMLLGFFGNIWCAFVPYPYCTNILAQVIPGPDIIGTPFIILMIFSALQTLAIRSGLLKNKASPATLTYIYVTGVAIGYIIGSYFPSCILTRLLASRITNPIGADLMFPEFMVPRADLIIQLFNGSTSIPWIDWIPFFSFWIILTLSSEFFFISISTIFRRQWIDNEKVPFPHTLPAYELIKNMQTESKGNRQLIRRPFTIGIIIGLGVTMPISLTGIFPWFPDIYSWRIDTCGNGSWLNPGGTHPLAGIVGITMLNKHPIVMALSYLVPISILQSFLIFWIMYLILIQVTYIGGYYTDLVNVNGCCRYVYTATKAPLRLVALAEVGGLVGLTLFYFILNRKYLLNTIRAIIGKGDLYKYENEEPMSYRIAYLTLVISFILVTALFLLCGISLAAAMIIPISTFVFLFAQTRLVGLAGVPVRGSSKGTFFQRLLLWPDVPSTISRDITISTHFSRNWGSDSATDGCPGLWTGFMSFRMASLMGVNNRNVVKVLFGSTVITSIITFISYVWMGYTFGINYLPGISRYAGSDIIGCGYNPEAVDRLPSPGNPVEWMPSVLLGMLIVGLLSFLHARFISFPLEPIGFIMAFGGDGSWWGIALPFLVAWVAKIVTFRIGGSKIYEDYGVPGASGVVIGSIIALLFVEVASIVRFFYPF